MEYPGSLFWFRSMAETGGSAAAEGMAEPTPAAEHAADAWHSGACLPGFSSSSHLGQLFVTAYPKAYATWRHQPRHTNTPNLIPPHSKDEACHP